ncbi:MAG TPA: response regulator [Thioalkalivibrio sp.]|nr:response regulator [Thioalkalivibrio sp.]
MEQQGRVRVLIVDDATMTRGILRLMLEIEGYEVVGEAASAREARTLAARLVPDIVFLDINLPDESGMAVLRHLHRERPDLGVVMITVDDTADRMRQAIREGALGYVIKPLSEDGAMATIRHILRDRFGLSSSGRVG